MSARFRLRPPVVQTSENDVEEAVKTLLQLRGLYPLRLHSGVFPTAHKPRAGAEDLLVRPGYIRIGEPGLPDYAVARFFVECKKPGGQLSLTQAAKIDALRRFWKLETAVVTSAEDMIRWLAEHPDL